MVKKIIYLLIPLFVMSCSFEDDQIDALQKTKTTNSVKAYSFTKEQAHRYAQIANDFAVVHMDDILGKAYFNAKTPPLFEFFYYVSKIGDKEYIALFLHEKPSTIHELDEVVAKGYTNVIFEINSKEDNLYFPHVIKIYPAYDYLTAKIKKQNLKEGDELDIRYLVNMDDFYGDEVYFEASERRLLQTEDLIEEKGLRAVNKSTREVTKKNKWLPEIIITKYPPGHPPQPDGSSPVPPRPSWGDSKYSGNPNGIPPTGGGNGGGGFDFSRPGGKLIIQDPLTPEEEKWKKIKNGETIMADVKIQTGTKQLWDVAMNQFTRNKERQELGFFIFYSATSGEYYPGHVQRGPIITDPSERAYLPIADYTLNPTPNMPADAVMVAWYHHHTAIGEAGRERKAGPSDEDIKIGQSYGVTVIVKDFEEVYDGDQAYIIQYSDNPQNQNTKFYYHHLN
ncbi:hypothetical protein [Myroides odoratus]|uniref:hypothetical protein n=1 Tax=Myroides odoratus TaxID=256 RepID=UPI003340793E